MITKAINSYANGRLDEAESIFRQILQSTPCHPQALYFLGLIALDKGINDEACQLLYNATLADRNNKDYKYTLAVALQENGKIDEAIAIYEKISDMAEAQNNLGNIYRMKKDLQKARSAFDKAIALNEKMVWAYVNKALLERQQNNQKQAEELLQKAIQIDADFIQAHYQLSIQNRLNENFNKSLEHVEKSITSNDKIDFLWVEYGKVLTAFNRNEEALNAFEKAIELNRFCSDAYFEKALILEKENPNLAEQAYRDVLRIDTQNIAAFNNLGTLLYRQNRIMEALEMYRNVFIVKPDDTTAAFNLAIALEDMADYEEAAGLYFKVLGQKQLQQQIHIRLANMLPKWYEKDAETAKKYAAGWLKNFDDNPLAIHTNNALNGITNTDENDFAYTQSFYNEFAESYDEKMKQLNCQIQNLIADKIKNQHFENVLDLGCGTGACGIFLKTQSTHLTGIDASQNMVNIAQQKQLYTKLYTQDIADYLTQTNELFDLIISADVFCYINKLNDIIKQTKKVLHNNGRFIFTVEKSIEDDKIILQPNGRYQHGLSTIKQILTEVGFNNIDYKEVILRQENAKDCIGYLFDVRK